MIDVMAERRTDPRLRAPKLRATCPEATCALLDVSAGGMRMFVTEPLFAELPFSLRLSKGRVDVDVEASVRWTRELPSAAGWIVGVRVTRGRDRLASLLAD